MGEDDAICLLIGSGSKEENESNDHLQKLGECYDDAVPWSKFLWMIYYTDWMQCLHVFE